MNRTEKMLTSIGLAMGFIFGMAGSFVKGPILQSSFYEISSVGLTVACALLALKFFRKKNDYLATGFLLFAIGEAVMSGGTVAGEVGGQASFGAGMALYVPALLLISIPKGFPLVPRFTGIVAAIPFLIAASKIFTGQQVLSSSPLAGAGYGLLTLTIIGWIVSFWREKKN